MLTIFHGRISENDYERIQERRLINVDAFKTDDELVVNMRYKDTYVDIHLRIPRMFLTNRPKP